MRDPERISDGLSLEKGRDFIGSRWNLNLENLHKRAKVTATNPYVSATYPQDPPSGSEQTGHTNRPNVVSFLDTTVRTYRAIR